MASKRHNVEVAGRTVSVSSPGKVVFPELGLTKLDLVEYYLAVAEGALVGVRDRPMVLKRFPKGLSQPPFYQKRVPKGAPDWLRTAVLRYASRRSAEEIVVDDAAGLVYCVQMNCIDLNPHPVRSDDIHHPDELRIDLDPVPGVEWPQIRDVAMVVKSVLDDHGLVGWPKTSGSRGIHVNVRIKREWGFTDVRRSALAIAREVERRAPEIATAAWWKEERHGVFIDYNQNAYDRTVASAYSVRPTPDARVSAPLTWDEVPDCEPGDFTVQTMPARYAALGDLGGGIDSVEPGDLTGLLALAERQEADQGDAPWPPNYPKMPDEPTRVQPSRAKGRRRPTKPLIIVAQSQDRDAAVAGLERWKARYPEAAAHLEPHHILDDRMRGRYQIWTRFRINLESVPEDLRPPQETPDPDDDPTRAWREGPSEGKE